MNATPTQEQTMRTDRATQAEKAEAWDRVMKSTADLDRAVENAWQWLDDKVAEREERGS